MQKYGKIIELLLLTLLNLVIIHFLSLAHMESIILTVKRTVKGYRFNVF